MGCLVFIVFLGFFVFLAVLINILRVFFGVRNAARRFMGNTPSSGKQQSRTEKTRESAPKKEKEKHFDKDEGEYVDFEEV